GLILLQEADHAFRPQFTRQGFEAPHADLFLGQWFIVHYAVLSVSRPAGLPLERPVGWRGGLPAGVTYRRWLGIYQPRHFPRKPGAKRRVHRSPVMLIARRGLFVSALRRQNGGQTA